MQVKVKNNTTFEVFEINGTINQAKREAIRKFDNKYPSEELPTAEIIGGIISSAVTLILKTVTKRRLTVEELMIYAEQIGKKSIHTSNHVNTMFWSEKEIKQVKEIIKAKNQVKTIEDQKNDRLYRRSKIRI